MCKVINSNWEFKLVTGWDRFDFGQSVRIIPTLPERLWQSIGIDSKYPLNEQSVRASTCPVKVKTHHYPNYDLWLLKARKSLIGWKEVF